MPKKLEDIPLDQLTAFGGFNEEDRALSITPVTLDGVQDERLGGILIHGKCAGIDCESQHGILFEPKLFHKLLNEYNEKIEEITNAVVNKLINEERLDNGKEE